MEFELGSTWSARVAPLFKNVWWEARREILLASRMEMDDTVWMTSPPGHMGDPAKQVDLIIHQHAADQLRREFPGIQVFGEEATLTDLFLSRQKFPYLACLDAIDGSAQAWSLPGAWGHVTIIQEFLGGGNGQVPDVALRFLGVLDAEGGVTMAEEALPYVGVDMTDRLDQDTYDDDWISYSDGVEFEITKIPCIMVGGYKPSWWPKFSTVRGRVMERWPATKERPGPPVFNTAGAPVTRKVIQNADNVAIQLTPSSLWDGAAAALVSRAGGHIIRVGTTDVVDKETVWSWWSQFPYQPKPQGLPGEWVPAMHIPAFVAGMDPERVQDVARMCLDLPG